MKLKWTRGSSDCQIMSKITGLDGITRGVEGISDEGEERWPKDLALGNFKVKG